MTRLLFAVVLVCGCGSPRTEPAPAPQPAQSPAAIADTDPAPHASDGELPPNAPAQLPGWTGQVVGVVDGDTIDVLADDKKTVRLRLNGIDTPERGQPFGNNATRWISDKIGGHVVRVVETDEPDRYGRLIADVHQNGRLINLLLVEDGLAWHYVKYAPDRDDLAKAEKLARAAKLGLWAGSHQPVPPWDWRKLSKAERDLLR